jgi:two-component system sensor histidine kinase UhpB
MPDRSLPDEFRRVIDNARDVIALYDADGNLLYVNPQGRREFFADKDADPLQHVSPEDRERVRGELAGIVRSGEPRRFELLATTRDGMPRLMQVEATPVRDASGSVMAVLTISRNVTEERRDEATVGLILETIFEQAPIGISVTDLDGHFLAVNRCTREILGFHGDGLPRKTMREMSPPEDRARIEVLREGLLNGTAERFEIEKRIIRAGGEVRWTHCIAAMARPPGRPGVIIELTEDITERREADDALRRSERLLREAQELGHTGSWEHDLGTGRILNTEENNRLFFGDDRSKGARLEDYIEAVHPDDRAYVIRRREQLLAEGGPREIEFRVVWPGGDIHVFYGLATVVRDESGRAVRVYGTNLDITERRKAEEALRQSREKLQALMHRLVELQETERRDIARELHDRVGQTLTAMRINMDMIRARLAERDDALIRSRNDDSLELIESAFKAVENVMYELRPPMIDEYGLIAPLRWYAKKFTERTGIHVEVRGDEGWRCDPDVELALFRIAQEALNNVARHARARQVTIELREIGPTIVLTIEDDGVGFDFDAQRAGKAGYGLTTMRERAESLGGTFEASSENGKGTRITVKVPRR